MDQMCLKDLKKGKHVEFLDQFLNIRTKRTSRGTSHH